MHNTELRSSAESLSEHQNSEGGEPCPTKSKTSNHLDWCGPWYKSNWHQGNFLRTPSAPSQASSYTQRTILATKRKWTIIFCHFLFARAQSIAASKMVTRLVRHYDQDERQSDASLRWNNMRTVLLKAFAKHGARNFSDEQCLRLGRAFENCEESKNLGLLLSNSRTLWWNTDWPSWWCTLEIFTIWIVYLSEGLVSHHPIFSRERTDIWWMKATKDGRLSSLNHLTSLVEIPMKKNQWWLHNSSKWVTVIPCTRSRVAILANKVSCDLRAPSCASRVHLHSNLSERRSNTVRKTLNTTTRANSQTERQLAIEAAATTAVSLFVSTCAPVQGNLLRI